jgi:hypothetical protein
MEPVAEEHASLAPVAEAIAPVPEAPGPAEEPPVAANDTQPEQRVKPILIGAEGEPPVEKKRGWWRR